MNQRNSPDSRAPFLIPTQGGVLIRLRVQPKSSREGVVGMHGDALKIAVHAPPDKGKANEAVIEVLAEAVGEAKSCFTIVAGETSRDKQVLYTGRKELGTALGLSGKR